VSESRLAPSVAMFALLQVSCGLMDPCGNEIVARTSSPGGAHEAIVFERDCGATTRWSTQVAIIRGGAVFRERPTWWAETQAGGALVIDDRTARPGIAGTSVAAKWSDDTHLTIEYDAGAAVLGGAKVVGGIEIEQRPVEHRR
jgi:hypothetical protein